MLAWLRNEVNKCCKLQRISERSLNELDARVQVECYVREKRDAILQDRGICLDNTPGKEPTNLERVQQDRLSIVQDKLEDVRSLRGTQQAASIISEFDANASC